VARLVLAADQFIVARATPDQPDGSSVIAGYHWFEDWGRDTMISLPGLTLATGRPEIAAGILQAFAHFVDQGMLPNRFPDAGTSPAYNTIDATLWYVLAIRAYIEATGDDDLLRSLWPTLESIVDWHLRGTRYGIKVDPSDGLLSGGQPGVQLTWMDAIVGDRVITPRIGKPIEVNALWFNALRAMVLFGTRLGEPVDDYERWAKCAEAGFARFWNPSTGYCYDVLDGPNGAEAELRPNQLLAISLPEPLLDPAHQQAILANCLPALLSSRGLRSLAPADPAFVGTYSGDQAHRDSAYHQGTVWGWLIGPLVAAHLRVHGDPEAAMRLLTPFADHLAAAGLGTVSEIFDGAPPFAPQGCIAQAWSVGEVLRAYRLIEQARLGTKASAGPGNGAKPRKLAQASKAEKPTHKVPAH
jgi:predicted glycogen debranching enzyme